MRNGAWRAQDACLQRALEMAIELSEHWSDRLDHGLVSVLRPAVRALHALHPTELQGAENLPETAAILVGNHGLLGYETLFFFERLLALTGRMPRGVTEPWVLRVPVLRDLVARVGGLRDGLEGTCAALRSGALVVSYPGGARELLKHHPSERYRLRWEGRESYVRAALRAGVPVVPFAAAGVDDTFAILSRLRGSGRLLTGRDENDLPLLLGVGPIPNPVPFWFRIGRPVALDHGPEAADDPQLVARLHAHVWSETQALLDGLVDDWRWACRSDVDAHDLPQVHRVVVGV